MQSQHQLTEPQERLLLKVHTRPAPIAPDYRPLKALIDLDLVRVRHAGKWGANPTIEPSEAGAKLAQEIKERRAKTGQECRCGREWSLKHEPPCPLSGRA